MKTLSGKEKFPFVEVSKEGHADSILGHNYHLIFLKKVKW